jgi:hypothetical protein
MFDFFKKKYIYNGMDAVIVEKAKDGLIKIRLPDSGKVIKIQKHLLEKK